MDKFNLNEQLLNIFELEKIDERILTKEQLKSLIPMIKILVSSDIMFHHLEKITKENKK